MYYKQDIKPSININDLYLRKYLQPKTLSVVNGIYDSERGSKCINEATEYSEIPECSEKTYSVVGF